VETEVDARVEEIDELSMAVTRMMKVR